MSKFISSLFVIFPPLLMFLGCEDAPPKYKISLNAKEGNGFSTTINSDTVHEWPQTLSGLKISAMPQNFSSNRLVGTWKNGLCQIGPNCEAIKIRMASGQEIKSCAITFKNFPLAGPGHVKFVLELTYLIDGNKESTFSGVLEGEKPTGLEKNDGRLDAPKKPVIYLYPLTKIAVDVKLSLKGDIIASYPDYQDGWRVIASPNGTLINQANNKRYYALFWEGELNEPLREDLSTGFIVAGHDVRDFFEEKLEEIGLNFNESNEFIMYWYPKMMRNEYNFIHFAEESYQEAAKLDITPKPDAILRVFMMYHAVNAADVDKYNLKPQTFRPFVRKGFSVVEWGGHSIHPR